jgi:formylglycine-generating enzyme required for sulfatase activity
MPASKVNVSIRVRAKARSAAKGKKPLRPKGAPKGSPGATNQAFLARQRQVAFEVLREYRQQSPGTTLPEPTLKNARRRLTDFAEQLFQHGQMHELNGLVRHIERIVDYESPDAEGWSAAAILIAEIVRRIGPRRFQPRPRKLLGFFNEGHYGWLSVHAKGGLPAAAVASAAEAVDLLGGERLDVRSADDWWVTYPKGWFKFKLLRQRRSIFESRSPAKLLPARRERLEKFQIARYLVTVQDFQRFVDAGGYSSEQYWDPEGFEKDFGEPGEWQHQLLYPTRPVVNVSWYEAAAYARFARARLPTEGEWERAARGKWDRKYPWGKAPPSPRRLNYAPSKLAVPTPVGIYADGATPRSKREKEVFDLAGNVSEWCADAVERFKILDRQRGSERMFFYVTRGGAFCDDARAIGALSRLPYPPTHRARSLGFRLARSV